MFNYSNLDTIDNAPDVEEIDPEEILHQEMVMNDEITENNS